MVESRATSHSGMQSAKALGSLLIGEHHRLHLYLFMPMMSPSHTIMGPRVIIQPVAYQNLVMQ